jgi:hypothetical protein
VIEDLIDLQSVVDRNLNRVGESKRIELEGCLDGLSLISSAIARSKTTSGSSTYDKLSPHVPFCASCQRPFFALSMDIHTRI